MLAFLKSFPSPRIAVLGDMRELGSSTTLSHRQLYQTALKSADIIISIGPETTKYFGPKSHKFTYWWQAAEYLSSHPELVSGSHILIKGSQNTIYLEELVKTLLKNSSDINKLCRQSKYWLNLKTKFKNNHT
jgi:UDP-N-acetylmuramyl pentapeptide synthase